MNAAATRPRIGTGGMSIEASAFSPHRSGFEAFNFTKDDVLLSRYTVLSPGHVNHDASVADGATWVPLVHARSLPGGMVEPVVYETLKAELIEMIHAQGPFDGFFLDIHGAMTVVGRQDAEADLARAVRTALDEVSAKAGSPRTLVSATMDLHGNVTSDLVEQCDLITCYRMAPHEDEQETKTRAMANLIARLVGGMGAPAKAYVRVPVLLPGEKTSTRLEPATGIYEAILPIEASEGIVDASIWVGYAWADEPRCYATVVVTGDDAELASAKATELAARYWDARAEFQFVAPAASLDACLAAALAPGASRPYLLSDSGDNPTAGGSGDVTWTLTQLINDPRFSDGGPRTVVASVFDKEAVAACFDAGMGSGIEVTAGALVDHVHSGPVTLKGIVLQLTEGDETSGRVAVVKIGSIEAIVTERRKPYHQISDFAAAGLTVTDADIVVVKIGYLEPELFELAADWMLMLTPGGVDQDLIRLGHKHIDRPMFPFDTEMSAPDLTATVFPAIPANA
ncbi:M81 family metallopeptidase [Paeniglutamicibacter gangotriensis]|uniref:Microcystin LR degradation protein MlrC n=2 Tax=Paeniglutamicibacter gangotriensis TaxID=254787 RepID=M7MSP1_9MICC|nr:M81 family metallopeptidase [Paeniglutamicibacter gangotriensis]EMQ97955.1 Microcystin LR degradation protein MlrC [Paeniglutamicibacter gangotriensis Lz1y]KAA0978877.1 M81 family metallopeptidase [Paeniglutamicibacter gangotriensis]